MKLLNEPFETTVLELVSILLCVIVGGQIACFWEKNSQVQLIIIRE